MHTIYLDPDDSIATINRRLDWVTGAERVLLVLPEHGRVLLAPLDLAQLRRNARERGLELGLVTLDGETGERAGALGIPVFASIATAEKDRIRWWLARRRQRRPARHGSAVNLGSKWRFSSMADEADRRTAHRRMRPSQPWRWWLARYLAILALIFVLTALIVAGLYVGPGARIVLRPHSQEVQVAVQIVADPQLESVNWTGSSVPARLLTAAPKWRAGVEATGSTQVPDGRARGTVVFYNLLDQAVTAPAGARVVTSAGEPVRFQLTENVEVPAGIGASAEAEVIATEPGAQGNVAELLVNRVEGSLGARLHVRNLEAMEGGGDRTVKAVTEADLERLREQVLRHLHVLAAAEMEAALLPDEFLAPDSVRIARIYEETLSQFAGDRAEQVTLEIRAELIGTAVQSSQAHDLVYTALQAAIMPGFLMLPDTVRYESGELLGVDDQGRVSLLLRGTAMSVAQVDAEPVIAAIAGQEQDFGLTYLYQQLPLRSMPEAEVWPGWFQRLPYLPARIQSVVETP